jgi:hypothetical protein
MNEVKNFRTKLKDNFFLRIIQNIFYDGRASYRRPIEIVDKTTSLFLPLTTAINSIVNLTGPIKNHMLVK